MLFLFFHSRGFSRLDRQCEAVLFGVARPDEVGALDVHLLLMFRIKMFVIITIIIFFKKKKSGIYLPAEDTPPCPSRSFQSTTF